MPNYVYPAIGLIGGTTGFLDAIDGTNLADKDMAVVSVQGDKTYFYVLDADSAAAEASPGIIAPDANGGDKRWILTGFTPVPAATGWTGAGGTTSKTLTVSSDADTKDIIKGDGTAGRVLRSISIWVQNATVAANIKCKSLSLWNGDANGDQDNIAKNATAGVWSLNVDGSAVTLLDTGISGDSVAILSCTVADDESATAIYVEPSISGGIKLQFRDVSGNNVDLTTLVDTGAIIVHVLYLTTA